MDREERFHVLVSGDFPPILGGESRFLYNIFYFLPTPDKAAIVPFAGGSRKIDSCLPFPVKRVYLWRTGVLKLLSPFLYFLAILFFKKRKPLIHCGQAMIPGMAGLLAKYFLGIPYVVYVHGAEFLKYVHFPLGTILRVILKNADKIVTNSRYTTRHVKKSGIPGEKIVHTLLGVDTGNFYPSPPDSKIIKRYGLENKRVIVTTCRLVDHKGVDMVIAALPRVLREAGDVVYLVAGSGEDRQRLERIAREKGVGDRIIFAGRVSDNALLTFYNTCELFIMPTREVPGKVDGFGISYIEANACGKPVIGGRSGGVADAIIDGVTGLLVDPGSTDEIAGAIIKLLKDKNYAGELGKNGLDRARKELTWEKIASLLLRRL